MKRKVRIFFGAAFFLSILAASGDAAQAAVVLHACVVGGVISEACHSGSECCIKSPCCKTSPKHCPTGTCSCSSSCGKDIASCSCQCIEANATVPRLGPNGVVFLGPDEYASFQIQSGTLSLDQLGAVIENATGWTVVVPQTVQDRRASGTWEGRFSDVVRAIANGFGVEATIEEEAHVVTFRERRP